MKPLSISEFAFTKRWMVLALAFLVFISFANCLKNDFIGDDKALFVDNQFYRTLHNLPLLFSKKLVMDPAKIDLGGKNVSFSGCVSYRPVPAATFFIDYAIWKARPFGHHLTNILLHLAVVILVFFLFSYLTGREKVAFFAAVLFAVHPIQSEVVNTIGYRSDLLAALFYLLGVMSYIKASQSQQKTWYIITAVSYLLALFSKESALTFPLVILFLDHFILSPGPMGKLWQERRRMYVLLGIISVFYLYIYFFLMPNVFYPRFIPGTIGAFGQAILVLKTLAQYLTVLFIPFKVTILPPLYAPPVYPVYWYELVVPLFAILLAFMCVGRFYEKNKIVAFAFLWILFTYLPVSGTVPLLNPFAFRFLYLPSVGFCLLVALLFERVITRIGPIYLPVRISQLIMATMAGICMVMTISNNSFFQNDFVACHEMIRNYPNSSRPYWVLGLNYYWAGKWDQAEKYFEKNIEIETNNPFISDDNKNFMAYYLLGRSVKDPRKAILYFNRALRINPRFSGLYLDAAKAYIVLKDFPKAVEAAEKALALDHKLAIAYVYIIHSDMESGRLVEARAVFEYAGKIFNDDPNLKAVGNYLKEKEQKNE